MIDSVSSVSMLSPELSCLFDFSNISIVNTIVNSLILEHCFVFNLLLRVPVIVLPNIFTLPFAISSCSFDLNTFAVSVRSGSIVVLLSTVLDGIIIHCNPPVALKSLAKLNNLVIVISAKYIGSLLSLLYPKNIFTF